ncbi:hypothetical protein FOMG_17713 [Fusarium oxysporum f. sp. melonis 26406]|uniref:Amino acid permease/ SLC12A domain-containing protein n=1 Tax=Fusarium oxysporum f. sp. melonis 26406 TaxID=1089452 RepID=W9ZX46_FUSOX|nr:hypothetical protein FOMG_17713 [Fusarium oxysporum f. sp. melonis 26406]
MVIGQIFVAICPPGMKGTGSAEDFFKACLAIPVTLLFWASGYFRKGTGWVSIDRIDLDTGRREHDWDQVNAYRAKVASWPAWRRAIHKIM